MPFINNVFYELPLPLVLALTLTRKKLDKAGKLWKIVARYGVELPGAEN